MWHLVTLPRRWENSHQTILIHLQKAGYKQKTDGWVTHDLMQNKNLIDCLPYAAAEEQNTSPSLVKPLKGLP
ncbi:Putative DD34D transposase [Caligus rogercresseyi]|uniref:DD34D transposase n=1 Tax=Caligus rogercresseyi TaxID=217165 RepID=A0A7T8QRU1_CALRO|nr:Putative DD34D transposase [Caligus rogercresseyi]